MIVIRFLASFLIFSCLFGSALRIEAKRTGYKLAKTSKAQKSQSGDPEEEDSDQFIKGSFMVASQCRDCNNGYMISQVAFSGYDKPAQASKEVFFITNNTDRTMSGVNLYLEYLDLEGRQLHKRFLRLTCAIPPGETRMAEVPSWDTNHSFHFIDSKDSKRGSVPYRAIIDPVAFYLKF